ncbi:hypothetical protein [Lachnobacterium bovis]|uniref:hypothetical protein n=1 Tax=Lachnobacterium bovis TaxID=140626 RepID=UPI0003B59584|nr:hypothetical protein [Lachnobacterium bovis]
MKKKIVSAILATALVASSLTGCSFMGLGNSSQIEGSKKSDKELVTEATESVLKDCQNADYDAILKDIDSSAKNDFKNFNMETADKAFYASLGAGAEAYVGDDIKTKVTNLWKKFQKDMIKSYKVKKVTIKDKAAVVDYDVKYAFTDKELVSVVTDKTVINEFKEECEKYGTDHAAEVQQIYLTEGETGLYKKIYNDLLPNYIEKVSNKYDDSKSGFKGDSYIYRFKLKIKKNKWVVTSLKSNETSKMKSK